MVEDNNRHIPTTIRNPWIIMLWDKKKKNNQNLNSL